jgi:hypothetical protein
MINNAYVCEWCPYFLNTLINNTNNANANKINKIVLILSKKLGSFGGRYLITSFSKTRGTNIVSRFVSVRTRMLSPSLHIVVRISCIVSLTWRVSPLTKRSILKVSRKMRGCITITVSLLIFSIETIG